MQDVCCSCIVVPCCVWCMLASVWCGLVYYAALLLCLLPSAALLAVKGLRPEWDAEEGELRRREKWEKRQSNNMKMDKRIG